MEGRMVQVIEVEERADGLLVHGVVERAGVEVPWSARRADESWRVNLDASDLGAGSADLVDVVMEQGPLDADIERELLRLRAV